MIVFFLICSIPPDDDDDDDLSARKGHFFGMVKDNGKWIQNDLKIFYHA